MTNLPKIRNAGSNQTIIVVNGVNLYFSYEACIAAASPSGFALFNPAYRGYSATTSKHATQMGVKSYRDAADEKDFADRVAREIAANED
jgi:hypothetical protein